MPENVNADKECFVTLKRWLENRNQNKNFVDYFHDYGFRRIAIYGAGDLGRLLYDEIKASDIVVEYFVDRNAEGLHEIDGIPVVTLSEINNMPEVDILVITPIGNYEAICSSLAVTDAKVRTISLREAVYEF